MAGKTIPVLLIEDNPGDARLIQEMLAESGDVRFELTTTARLDDGVARLREGGFRVVLLDLSLPDSQGLDTFRCLHEATATLAEGVPVVVLTGLADTDLAVQAVQEGAQDYLVKNDVDGRRLGHALHYALSRHARQAAVERAHRDNEEELGEARTIQQHLFPRRPPRLPGFDIHGACYPAVETGGDFFDYLPLGGSQHGIVVGDVTSHGVGPALLMAATRAYLRAFSQMTCDIGQILARTNRLLAEDVDWRNVTLLLARLDCDSRRLQHTSAGHWPGYVLDGSGAVREELLSTDLALGIAADSTFTPAEAVELRDGDLVLIMTDGILEAYSPARGFFGSDRALEYVRAHRAESAESIVGGLYEEVRRWEGELQHDDVTAVVIKVVPAKGTHEDSVP